VSKKAFGYTFEVGINLSGGPEQTRTTTAFGAFSRGPPLIHAAHRTLSTHSSEDSVQRMRGRNVGTAFGMGGFRSTNRGIQFVPGFDISTEFGKPRGVRND